MTDGGPRLYNSRDDYLSLIVRTWGVAVALINITSLLLRRFRPRVITYIEKPMWESDGQAFDTNRLGELKNHLTTGGTAWRGAVSIEFDDTLLVKMGGGMDGRTWHEWCVRSQ